MANKNLRLLLFAVTYCGYAILYSTKKPFSVVKAALQVDLPYITTYTLGAIDTAFLATYAVGQTLLPSLTYGMPTRLLLLLCYASSSIFSFVFGVSSTSRALIVAWMGNGLAHASVFPLMIQLLSPFYPREIRGRYLSAWTTSQQVGATLATVLAASTSKTLGWRAAFLVPAGMVGAMGFVIYNTIPEDPSATPQILEKVDSSCCGEGDEEDQRSRHLQNCVSIEMRPPSGLEGGMVRTEAVVSLVPRSSSAAAAAAAAEGGGGFDLSSSVVVPSSSFQSSSVRMLGAAGLLGGKPTGLAGSQSSQAASGMGSVGGDADSTGASLITAATNSSDGVCDANATNSYERACLLAPLQSLAASPNGIYYRKDNCPSFSASSSSSSGLQRVTGNSEAPPSTVAPSSGRSSCESAGGHGGPSSSLACGGRSESMSSPPSLKDEAFSDHLRVGAVGGDHAPSSGTSAASCGAPSLFTASVPLMLQPFASDMARIIVGFGERIVQQQLVQLLLNPEVSKVALSYFFTKLVRYSLLFWLPYYLTKGLSYEPDVAGYLSIFFDIGGFFGAVCVGYIADIAFGGNRLSASALMSASTVLILCLFSVQTLAGASMSITMCLLLISGFCVAGPDALLGGSAAQDLCDRGAVDADPVVVSGESTNHPTKQTNKQHNYLSIYISTAAAAALLYIKSAIHQFNHCSCLRW
eukprot:GHVU01121719.1.p1 GENE.GHVU01121719.1~~GHVU01121719.1.p1  ORF type:complete len:695 (+),score=90.50 GHVU01121719.1:303-2387(+)